MMKPWEEMTWLEKAEKTKKMYEDKVKEYGQRAAEAKGEDKLYFFMRINDCFRYILGINNILKREKELTK